MDLAILAVLRSPEGALLAKIGIYDEDLAVPLGVRLRERHHAALVAAAITQARLRTRALSKLGPYPAGCGSPLSGSSSRPAARWAARPGHTRPSSF